MHGSLNILPPSGDPHERIAPQSFLRVVTYIAVAGQKSGREAKGMSRTAEASCGVVCAWQTVAWLLMNMVVV